MGIGCIQNCDPLWRESEKVKDKFAPKKKGRAMMKSSKEREVENDNDKDSHCLYHVPWHQIQPKPVPTFVLLHDVWITCYVPAVGPLLRLIISQKSE